MASLSSGLSIPGRKLTPFNGFHDISGFGHAFGIQSALRFDKAVAVSTARSRGGYGRATLAAASFPRRKKTRHGIASVRLADPQAYKPTD